MPRELRRRTSRPNYAVLADFGDEDGAGPSHPMDEAFESGSDFAPEDGAGDEPDEEEEEEDELEEDDAEDEDEKMSEAHASDLEGSIVVTQSVSRAPKKSVRKTVSLAPGISVRQQSFVLPATHHRHRAVPLHERPTGEKAERLASRPEPLKAPEIVPTKHYGEAKARVRIPKSWSYNVGPGPIWELLEDRGWFGEAASVEDEHEALRRPRVHEGVQVKPGLLVLSREEAAVHLPRGQITCSFGPYGQQQRHEMKLFDTVNMDRFFPEITSHVFSAGGPVWAIDWCPLSPDGRAALGNKQYLAVGPLPSHDYTPLIGDKKASPACIQIWSISPPTTAAQNGKTGHQDSGYMRCEMVLCIDIGPAHDLKWCPLPSHDKFRGNSTSGTRKLGLLAGTFEDGSMSVFVVPYPPDVALGTTKPGPGLESIFIKMTEPLVRIEREETACWSLDWGNSEVIAVGCANGSIAVYNITDIISTGEMLPTHFFNAHQSAIRSLAWVRAPTVSGEGEVTSDAPTVLISGGYDGVLHAVDIRMPCGNDISRTRDAINTVCFSTYCGGPISIDQGLVKVVSLSPVLLNKGHTVLDPEGPVWHLGASDYHPQIACAVSDGSCLTTNTMRNTRRGGIVPFLEHKIYQMDYNRKTKEYRMLEHFKPKVIPPIGGVSKAPPKVSSGWPPEVGVHRAVWNDKNGLANAPWLASGTASGLCRVDWLTGKWLSDQVPYTDIEGIRGERDEPEGEGHADEDSD